MRRCSVLRARFDGGAASGTRAFWIELVSGPVSGPFGLSGRPKKGSKRLLGKRTCHCTCHQSDFRRPDSSRRCNKCLGMCKLASRMKGGVLAFLSVLSLFVGLCGCALWARAGSGTRFIWEQRVSSKQSLAGAVERDFHISRSRLVYVARWQVAGSLNPPAYRKLLPSWVGRFGLYAYDGYGNIVGVLPDFATGHRRYFFTAERTISLRMWAFVSAMAILPATFLARISAHAARKVAGSGKSGFLVICNRDTPHEHMFEGDKGRRR